MPEMQGTVAGNIEKQVSGLGKEPETLTLTRSRTHKSQSATRSTILPGAAQWESIMRKFSQAHKETCKSVPKELPYTARSLKTFPTGSTYDGTWDPLGMSGQGTYTFPHKGAVYKGGFYDGEFHGDGEVLYECGAVMKGKWNKGKLISKQLFFADGLEYFEEDWAFCRPFDRRFTIEHDNGLQPADITYKTAEQPPRQIPPGHYDVGYGFYDSVTKSIYKYDDPTGIVSSPDPHTAKWIENTCRLYPGTPIGPCPFLYEEWLEPTETLDPELTPCMRSSSTEIASQGSQLSVFSDKVTESTLHRPKGKLFASRSRLFEKTGFYDPRFCKGSESDVSQKSPCNIEMKKDEKSYNENLESASKIKSNLVAFKLQGSAYENEISNWGLAQSKTPETMESYLSTSAHKVYEQGSDNYYESCKLSVMERVQPQADDSLSGQALLENLKHMQALVHIPQESGAIENKSQSAYNQNTELLVQEFQTQGIEQNIEQEPEIVDRPDIQVVEASAQDQDVGANNPPHNPDN